MIGSLEGELPRGGRRPGAGRPRGAPDLAQRKPKEPRANHAKVKRIKAMVEDFDPSEYLFTSDDKVFKGSALAFIKSVYTCEPIPVKTRLYAATKAAEYETRISEDGQPLGAEAQVHIWLPHNGRDEELLVATGALTQAELDEYHEAERRRLAEVAEKDERLHKDVLAGKFTEAQAIIARRYYTQPNDPAWTPPPRPPALRLPWHRPEPAPAPAANGVEVKIDLNEIEVIAAPVKLRSAPNSLYEINGRVYRGNRWSGVIEPDAELEDVEQLIAAGCRRWQ
jgi:hypothetical protein